MCIVMDRFNLVKESFEKKEVPVEIPSGKTSDYFGELVFDRKKMAKYLDADSLKALISCIEGGKPLGRRDPRHPLVPASYRRHGRKA